MYVYLYYKTRYETFSVRSVVISGAPLGASGTGCLLKHCISAL